MRNKTNFNHSSRNERNLKTPGRGGGSLLFMVSCILVLQTVKHIQGTFDGILEKQTFGLSSILPSSSVVMCSLTKGMFMKLPRKYILLTPNAKALRNAICARPSIAVLNILRTISAFLTFSVIEIKLINGFSLLKYQRKRVGKS